MSEKLSFQELQNICQALGEFADARSQEKPDKDVILTIKKINGQEVLETTRLSKMSWCARIVRWFGFGSSTLKSVARYLNSNEPYIPSFYRLKDRDLLAFSYTEDAINSLADVEKERWKELKKQKIQGCEIFKRCLSHHNRKYPRKIYMLLQENEKTDLRSSGSIFGGGISHTYPNPMGIFPDGDKKILRAKYRPPIIDQSKFLFLKPFFRDKDNNIPPQNLGFCYEYGLGTKKNIEEAIQNYREAANLDEYSACYNLARLLLKRGDVQEAIDSLKKAEDILSKKIDDAKKSVENIRAEPDHIRYQELLNPDQPLREETPEELERRMKRAENLEKDNAPYIKRWDKDLRKLYPVFIEAYSRTGDDLLKAEYEQKAVQ